MNKSLFNACLERAKRTFFQILVATIPAGLTITPSMVQGADFLNIAYILIAWLLTALIGAFVSFGQGYTGGLPEVGTPSYDEETEDFREDIEVKEKEAENV